MKIISTFALIAVSGVFVWLAGGSETIKASGADHALVGDPAFACGCGDLSDLQNRLRAVDAAILALQGQVSLERWQEEYSPSVYQREIGALISSALGGTRSGRFGTVVGNLDPNTCTIRPETPAVSACFSLAIARNLETRREACENWRDGDGRTGNDYRLGQPTYQIIEDEIAAYRNEKDFLEEQIQLLGAMQCGGRGRPGGATPVTPPGTPPGTTPPGSTQPNPGRSVPPGRLPPGVVLPPTPIPGTTGQPGPIPPGGVPIGVPPPTGGPPVVPPPIPPPVVPPVLPPTGGGGPIGLRRISGHVRYIFDGTMNFPGLGVFKLTSDSRIPFSITQNRITGGGTTILNFDTSGSQCKLVRPFDGRADMTVSGRLTGRTMNVTYSSRGGSQTTSESVKLECVIEGGQAFGYVLPIQQQAFSGQQRLTLPRQGQPYTEVQIPIGVGVSAPTGTNVGGAIGLTGTITLRVYVP